MKTEKNLLNRRRFLGRLATVGAAGLAFPFVAPRSWAGTKGPALRVALIGVGGRGAQNSSTLQNLNVVCPCYADVDTRHWRYATEYWPNAQGFQDYRTMFDRMNKEFDAVVITIPDHHHFPASMLALMHGKHCYTEKPLTHSIGEARLLNLAAAKKNLATQMGNQGRANTGNRLTHSWIKSGAIGELLEVHCWTNAPSWPQGVTAPRDQTAIPPELDWDVFLGPAPFRPYHEGTYHPFKWRGWWDFGGGALGDIAAHTMDGFYWGIHPRQPTSFEMVRTTGFNGESFPTQSIVRLTFGAENGQPELPVYWYSGGLKPERPKELDADLELSSAGALLVGSKATILTAGSTGESSRIIPRKKLREIGRPDMLMEPSPGHAEEWLMACRGEKPLDFPKSNFSYAGPFTEVINLGVLAHQLKQGEKAHWDSRNLRVTDRLELNRFVHNTYREGWDFGA